MAQMKSYREPQCRDRGAWWAAVYGVAQTQTRLKRLSSGSTEALGGPDNPINVAKKVAVAPEQVKEISEELEGCC